MNNERRYQAGRPYYRKPEKPHTGELDYLLSMAFSLAVGAMLGATIAMGILL